MIPITLTIKGVYSYKEKQTIDFIELTSDHLFGIFGTVGSGKSSILEAITFALYGKIERLNSKGLKYNMMNLSSNEMFIDFTFQANNGLYYNTISHFKRNSKKHGDINTGQRNCYLLDSFDFEKKQPITTEEIEQIIGLSYENFKRTIIIPQGKFQEFLKLGVKERSNMLEEIFDLKKFNLFEKTKSLLNKSLTRRSEIEGSLSTLGTINIEEPQQLSQQIETTSQLIENKNLEKSILETQKSILDQLKKDIEEITITANKLEKAESNREAIEQKRCQLEQYRIFISVLKPVLEQQKGVSSQLDELNKTLLKKKEEWDEALKGQNLLQQQLLELTPEYETRATLLEKHLDIENLLEIKKNKEKILQLKQKEEQFNKDIASKKALNESKNEELKQIDLQLETLKSSLVDINSLNDVKSWHILNDNIIKEGKERRERVKLLEDENLKLDAEISTLLLSENLNIAEGFESLFANISTQISTQKQQLQMVDLEIDELKLTQQLSQYADTLRDGKPCPLCGALEHPSIRTHENVVQVLTEKQSLQELVFKQIEKLNKLETQLKEKQTQKSGLVIKLETAKNELETQLSEFSQHEKTFVFNEKYKDKSLVDAEIAKCKTDSKTIIDLEAKLKNTRTIIDSKAKELASLEQELHQFTLKKIEFSTIIQQRISALRHLAQEEYLQKTETDLTKIGHDFSQLHKTIEKQFEQVSKDYSDLKIKQSSMDGSLLEIDNQKENIILQKKEIDRQLEKEQLQHPQISDEIVTQFLKSPLNIDLEEQNIKQFDEQIITLTSALKTLNDKNKSTNYDAQLHQQLIEQMLVIANQIQTETEHKGQLSKQLEIVTKQLLDYQQFKLEFDKLENRIGDLNKILSMFLGNKFVNYVATYYLENLCKEANKRFVKLSNGHLELKLSSDNSFDVIDHLNNGYTRSSDSLSGGQTFQASLCLALALSDAINRKSNIRQNFFFIDEGFGSLDNQSLQTVFQALQALRMENRIVGLISHVEEMKQEIPKCLIISNTDENGSKIGYGWKN